MSKFSSVRVFKMLSLAVTPLRDCNWVSRESSDCLGGFIDTIIDDQIYSTLTGVVFSFILTLEAVQTTTIVVGHLRASV